MVLACAILLQQFFSRSVPISHFNDFGGAVAGGHSQKTRSFSTLTPRKSSITVSTSIHISLLVLDTDGNPYSGPTASYYFYLNSAATPDTNAPTVTAVAPAAGSTVGDNALINVTFSKGMDPVSINAATITVNSGVVPASFSFNNNTNVVVTPLAPLPDNASLTLTLVGGAAGIIDPSGNALTTQTVQFSTGNGPDITQPFVVSSTVSGGLTVPSNAVFSVQFNKPMDTRNLLIPTNFYLYDNNTNTYLPTNRSFSADSITATINPTSPLPAGHNIQFGVYNAQDLSGNTQVAYNVVVTASSSPDTVPPVVLATNPGIGQTSTVSINTKLQVLFNKPVQNGSLLQITLSGGAPVALTPALTNGDQTVLLIPNAPLAPNTNFTLTIQGVKSTAGFAMTAPVIVFFTTGPGATLLGPTVTGTNPLNGAMAVPVSVTPTVTFSAPINSLTTYGYIVLRLSSTNAVVPSTLSFSADYRTVTITPNSPLSAATQYNVYVGGSNITDQAGYPNQTGVSTYNFTTQ
jgi:hypothetical protein